MDDWLFCLRIVLLSVIDWIDFIMLYMFGVFVLSSRSVSSRKSTVEKTRSATSVRKSQTL